MKHTIRKVLAAILSIMCVCTMLFAVACGEEKKTNENSSEPTVSSSAEDSSDIQSSEDSSSQEQSSQEQSSEEQSSEDSSSEEQSSSSGGGEEQQPVELPAAPNYSNDVKAELVIGGYDGGPGVEKVILSFPNDIPASAVETRSLVFNWGGALGNASRDKLYLCNRKGRKVNGVSSKYVAIEYVVTGNQWGIGDNLSPFTYSNMNNWKAMENFSLTMNNFNVNGNVYTRFTGNLEVIKSVPTLDKWDLTKTHTKNGQTISYASYAPEVPDGEVRPLIIWLHGAGEGGTDPAITILGNKVVALAEEKIQSYFPGGAFVLAPQATTFWMSTTEGSASSYDSKSIYYDTLEDLIRTYVSSNPKIDAKRVYVGGCSNGGWCTLEVVGRMGDFFAACYPVCAPYTRAHFTDEMFENLKKVPMWMIAANNDTSVTLNNNANSKSLYMDLLAAGKTDVYFSLFNDVNVSGVGGANYAGHYSWIWVFRDEVNYVQALTGSGENGAFTGSDYNPASRLTVKYNGKDVNLWQWLSTFKNDGTRVDPVYPAN